MHAKGQGIHSGLFLCYFISMKKILIEYLYLDLKTCERCVSTDAVLDKVVEALAPALNLAGYQLEYHKQEISTPELAKKYHFLSSPTVRVNGIDIFGKIKETGCSCCGEIAGTDVDCRAYDNAGQTVEVPTEEMMADAILRAVYNPAGCSCGTYRLPGNLKRFFIGKKRKSL
ncbi:MAG: DUF2703 domain-containing protein [Spirochaetia bacterium]|nr:DUF2703 domain-containing protein [Spirochaetia bacterium]MBP5739753.1 DUF2703 domain-containing protein [Spirochaetia bacterium]